MVVAVEIAEDAVNGPSDDKRLQKVGDDICPISVTLRPRTVRQR